MKAAGINHFTPPPLYADWPFYAQKVGKEGRVSAARWIDPLYKKTGLYPQMDNIVL